MITSQLISSHTGHHCEDQYAQQRLITICIQRHKSHVINICLIAETVQNELTMCHQQTQGSQNKQQTVNTQQPKPDDRNLTIKTSI